MTTTLRCAAWCAASLLLAPPAMAQVSDDVVRIGVEQGPRAGFAAEARAFGELVDTPQARTSVGRWLDAVEEGLRAAVA